MPDIQPELSAQGYTSTANPMASRCRDLALKSLGPNSRAADQGCGRLRNLEVLASGHSSLLLVDTKKQLDHTQLFKEERQTIKEFAESWNEGGEICRLEVMSAGEFANSQLDLDVIYSIATYDAVPAETRSEMAKAAAQNLKTGGLYFIVAPRNDSSILQRCTEENSYEDGHVFKRNGMHTFFRNYKDTSDLVDLITSAGFSLENDLSVYRQATLVFNRA